MDTRKVTERQDQAKEIGQYVKQQQKHELSPDKGLKRREMLRKLDGRLWKNLM